eukprot:scaffold5777_cov41-Tisochrysis_lutea.AAC.3
MAQIHEGIGQGRRNSSSVVRNALPMLPMPRIAHESPSYTKASLLVLLGLLAPKRIVSGRASPLMMVDLWDGGQQ